MDRGAADEVLGRLARMPDVDQRAIYADRRYQAKRAALPEGREQSAAGHLKHSLGLAESLGAQRALLAYPTTNDSEHKVHVEAIGAQVDAAGPGAQASLRRAYVLVERLGGPALVRSNPALLGTLAPADRRAVDQLLGPGGPLARRDHLDRDNDKETASQLIFGQPQLAAPRSADGKPGGSDPSTEADFMYFRLREAAGIRHGVALADWLDHEGPRADEAVAEFMTLYQRVHAAGVTGGDLAQLAEHYHHALRHLDAYRAATESLAGTAAQIVGATVATIVVTVASGGTLGPIAVGAMASLGAAAAGAANRPALRVRS